MNKIKLKLNDRIFIVEVNDKNSIEEIHDKLIEQIEKNNEKINNIFFECLEIIENNKDIEDLTDEELKQQYEIVRRELENRNIEQSLPCLWGY